MTEIYYDAMLNRITNSKRVPRIKSGVNCATDDASSNAACYKTILIYFPNISATGLALLYTWIAFVLNIAGTGNTYI